VKTLKRARGWVRTEEETRRVKVGMGSQRTAETASMGSRERRRTASKGKQASGKHMAEGKRCLALLGSAKVVLVVAASMLNIGVIGVGLVGTELVSQIRSSRASFSLFSLSSSTRTLFHPGADWKSALGASPIQTDLAALTKQLRELVDDHQHVAVVDNTSSDLVAALYPVWLRHGFHVVTSNKKAFSGELALWEDILKASSESGARFLNEATVGAGLPVINTLKELVASGDKVLHPIPPCILPFTLCADHQD